MPAAVLSEAGCSSEGGGGECDGAHRPATAIALGRRAATACDPSEVVDAADVPFSQEGPNEHDCVLLPSKLGGGDSSSGGGGLGGEEALKQGGGAKQLGPRLRPMGFNDELIDTVCETCAFVRDSQQLSKSVSAGRSFQQTSTVRMDSSVELNSDAVLKRVAGEPKDAQVLALLRGAVVPEGGERVVRGW